jgi:hypothetical protein
VFLTQVVDPQCNALALTSDNKLRLTEAPFFGNTYSRVRFVLSRQRHCWKSGLRM